MATVLERLRAIVNEGLALLCGEWVKDSPAGKRRKPGKDKTKMAGRQFYNYMPEDVMQADLAEVKDHALCQYMARHIYASFLDGRSSPVPDAAYERCAIELLGRLPAPQREAILKGQPVEECYPAIGLYVLEQMTESERLLMGRVASRFASRAARKDSLAGGLMEMIPSNLIYQFTQRAIARAPEGIFRVDGMDFPRYTEQKDGFNASLEMRPNDDLPAHMLPNYEGILASMNEKLDRLGDVAVDVMDIILSRYLKNTGSVVRLTTDEILQARGIRPKTKGGYSAGHRPEDKRKISSVMAAMDNLWIVVGELEVYVKGKRKPRRFREKSRLMMITGITEQVGIDETENIPIAWRVSIGEVFTALLSSEMATQYALLSTKTLQYDPYRQRWEKRLSRYFHPLWRIRQADESFAQPIRVQTLLDAIGMEIRRDNPQRTRDRFEQALDRLTEDEVLGGWNYAIGDADEEAASRRGWVDDWLTWRVCVQPAVVVADAYRAGRATQTSFLPPPVAMVSTPEQPPSDPVAILTGEEVLAERKRAGMTQAQMAAALGVSRSLVAQVELGRRTITDDFAAAFFAWRDRAVQGEG